MVHAHSHKHDHAHGSPPGGHSHAHGASLDRAFAIGIGLNVAIVALQVGFGIVAHSLALLADGAHNLSDVLALVLSWVGLVLSRRRPTERRTYGYRKASVLAALANAALLFLVTGGIVVEALRRLLEPEPVAGATVIWVAAVGIAVNGATALLFMRGRHDDLNVRGAFLHMAGDAAISLGVVVAAVAILWTGWWWIDPVISLAIAAAIIAGTWGLARDSLDLALDAVPAQIDRRAVHAYLAALPGVVAIHDLHIWAMSTSETALTAHLVRPSALLDDDLLARAAEALSSRFGIAHATLQVEAGDPAHPCRLADAAHV